MISLSSPKRAVIPPLAKGMVNPMFTSKADVFRTRQVLRDLAEAICIHKDAVLSLGTTGAEKEAIARIVDAGCVIPGSTDSRVYTQLLLSAALPEDDYPAFIAATIILLTDRLNFGAGKDDLYWNWEAFQDHYRLADPPVRAAVLNGFRMAHLMGRVSLGDNSLDADCVTRSADDVLSMIEGEEAHILSQAIREEVTAEEAGALWDSATADAMTWQSLTGFRYLYERPQSMRPARPESAPLIPWV